MTYELLIGVAGGIMIGSGIVLWRVTNRIVEMQRAMEGLVQSILSGSRIPIGNENDPFGEIAASKIKERARS